MLKITGHKGKFPGESLSRLADVLERIVGFMREEGKRYALVFSPKEHRGELNFYKIESKEGNSAAPKSLLKELLGKT